MQKILQLQPVQFKPMLCLDTDEGDSVMRQSVRVELRASEGPLPSGWVLIKGEVLIEGAGGSLNLIAETDERDLCYPLPATRKGTVVELIQLPEGVRRLHVELIRASACRFRLGAFSLTSIGQIERIVRMWRRVLSIYITQPRERRKRAGLRLLPLAVNLRRAYEISGCFRAYSPSISYLEWVTRFDRHDRVDRYKIVQMIRGWKKRPYFHVLLWINSKSELENLDRSIKSLHGQLYRNFDVFVLYGSDLESVEMDKWKRVKALNVSQLDCLSLLAEKLSSRVESDWVVCMRPGDILGPQALFRFAYEAIRHPCLMMIYSDHDQVDGLGGRFAPVFKPDFSLEFLRSTNYIGDCAAVRLSTLFQIDSVPLMRPHEIWLRVAEVHNASSIGHVPEILWHQALRSEKEQSDGSGERLIDAHLNRLGLNGKVVSIAPGCYRIFYEIPRAYMVSIIVPTRDAPEYLKTCLESVLNRSSYKNYEIIVVDNGSTDPDAVAYLKSLESRDRVRVLSYDHPFNYSAINNFAQRFAKGDVLCLLNNDTEVISPDWMQEMLGKLCQESVGVVGAKLYYRDGRVQHGGVVIGSGGCANHMHSFLTRGDPGYCNRAILAQDLSAVTGACLMTWRKLYIELGGLDAINLPVAFNDVDYCLRVREAGYRVIWTPFAELYHDESVSRGKDCSPEKAKRASREVSYMRKRWKRVMQRDPFYNPNCSYIRPDFSLSPAPSNDKVWLR